MKCLRVHDVSSRCLRGFLVIFRRLTSTKLLMGRREGEISTSSSSSCTSGGVARRRRAGVRVEELAPNDELALTEEPMLNEDEALNEGTGGLELEGLEIIGGVDIRRRRSDPFRAW